jgi:acetyl esterase/lipase
METVTMRNTNKNLNASKMLNARGRLALRRGDRETALTSAETLGSLARSHEEEPALIVLLIGLAIEKLQLALVNDLVAAPQVGLASGMVGLFTVLGVVTGTALATIGVATGDFVLPIIALGVVHLATMVILVFRLNEGRAAKDRGGWETIGDLGYGGYQLPGGLLGPDSVVLSAGAGTDVSFEADTVRGISGVWAKPARPRKGATILHVHGGWFNLGTARAYRNLVGHIASSAGADAFIPDYRLAPEHPFPAAVTDVEACYRGLVDRGTTKIAVTGDSAGGALALVLLSIAGARDYKGGSAPVGAVAISPVTDLALTGESYETRAEADPYFTKSQAAGLVASYLGETNATNPLASPLYGELSGLPPIRVHVGDDEVLLDDSRRYVERAVSAGVDAQLDVWMGMPHGFVTAVREFAAARQALNAIGTFLKHL